MGWAITVYIYTFGTHLRPPVSWYCCHFSTHGQPWHEAFFSLIFCFPSISSLILVALHRCKEEHSHIFDMFMTGIPYVCHILLWWWNATPRSNVHQHCVLLFMCLWLLYLDKPLGPVSCQARILQINPLLWPDKSLNGMIISVVLECHWWNNVFLSLIRSWQKPGMLLE